MSASLLQAVPLVMVFFVFYSLVIRPGRVAEAQRFAAVQSLKGGEAVVTSHGMLGRVTEVDRNWIEVEIAEGVRVKLLQDGIRMVVPLGHLERGGAPGGRASEGGGP